MTNDALNALDAIDKFIQQCNDYEGQWPDDVPKLFIGHTKPIRAALAPVDVEGKIKSILSVVQYDSRNAVEKDLRMLLSPVDVEGLANYIRTVDGNNTMGAGELAEKIIDHLAARWFGVPDSEWNYDMDAAPKYGVPMQLTVGFPNQYRVVIGEICNDGNTDYWWIHDGLCSQRATKEYIGIPIAWKPISEPAAPKKEN